MSLDDEVVGRPSSLGIPVERISTASSKSVASPASNQAPDDQAKNHVVKPTALTEVDPNISSGTNGLNPQKSIIRDDTKSGASSGKKVTISQPTGDDNVSLPNGQAMDQSNDGPDLAEREIKDEAGNDDDEVGLTTKKKKNKKKPKSKRGLNAPTGFEEFYVDAPLTPAEYQEERSIYDPKYQFTQRIETAIQRFVARRRFTPETTTLFDRYLVHGGVKGGPKMFSGGTDRKTLESKNAAEIAELTAKHYVDYDKVDTSSSSHVVDFEGCLRSFLSGQLSAQWDLDSEEKVKQLVGVLRNFFNYILHHDVCPEYTDQIYKARALCDTAVTQIWNIASMSSLLPGDFNMACSEIFGGMYQGMFEADQEWTQGLDIERRCGISPEQARKVFKFAMAANATDDMFPKYRAQLQAKTCRVISTEDIRFEITSLSFANEGALNLYGEQQCAGIKSLSKMRAKSWLSLDAQDEDLTEDEEAYLRANPLPLKEYEFWMEDEILQKCSVGMKFEATVRETSFGLTYFDAMQGLHPSFYHLIANDFMGDWKEVEKEWLPMRKNKLDTELENGKQDDGLDDKVPNVIPDEVKLPISPSGDQNGDANDQRDHEEANRNLIGAGYDDGFAKKSGVEEKADQDHDAAAVARSEDPENKVKKVGEESEKPSGNVDKVVQVNRDREKERAF